MIKENIISIIATGISIAAFVFSLIKYRSEQKAALHIKCTFNENYRQYCEFTNNAPNSAKNIKLTLLDDRYTFDEERQQKVKHIESIAAQNTYKFSLYRDSEILDIEFTDVKVLVEWQDHFKKHNTDTMIIQIPEQGGF